MFKSFSLKQKILAGGLLPLLFVGLVNIIGLINFNGVVESYDQVSHTYNVTEMGRDIEKAALNMQTGSRGYLLTGNVEFLEPYTEGSQKYQRLFRELKQITTDKESFDTLVQAENTFNIWKSLNDQYIQKRKELNNSPHVNDVMSHLVSQQKGKKTFDVFRAQMQIFDTKKKTLLNIRIKDAERITRLTNNIIIFGTSIALFLAVIIVVFIVRIIIAPITKIKESAMRISEGETDVGINIDSHDELGQMAQAFNIMVERLRDITNIAHQIGEGNLNISITKHSEKDILGNALENMVKNLTNISTIAHKIGQGDLNVTFVRRSESDILGKALENMVANLNAIMTELKEGTFALNSATAEILATTSQVSSGASQTSSAVAQTFASIEQIKQTAKVSSAKATKTVESTTEAIEIAKSGTEGLNENMKGLNQIKEKMDLIASNIIQLSDQSQMIGEIITTVEDIANQSNMLAVNASIEAVKAGEQGKGFSVVAGELKNLAEQSKQGTKQVQKILFDIQKVTGTLVMVAEQGSKAVENGVQQAQKAKTSMDQLNSSVYNAANAGKQIAASYEQELAGMGQISSAIGSIKEATSQNLSSIKQVEMSAKDLSALSQKLKEVMDHYTIAGIK